MLELIELEARARAIRSQLALEPVTKIELDDSEEEEEEQEQGPVTGPQRTNPQSSQSKSSTTTKKTSEDFKQSSKKASEPAKKNLAANKKSSEQRRKSSELQRKSPEAKKKNTRKSPSPKIHPPTSVASSKRIVVHKLTDKSSELIITVPKSKQNVPPVKLKRNFVKTSSETSLTTSETLNKDIDLEVKLEMMNVSRSSSPDIITMEQNIATYFISDSDDEPPTKKKSPEKSPQKKSHVKKDASCIEKTIDDPIEQTADTSQENPSISNLISDENSQKVLDQQQSQEKSLEEKSELEKLNENPVKQSSEEAAQEEDDGDVVNLMSDTEIDLNANSDKEEEVKEAVNVGKVGEERNENINNSTKEETTQVEKPEDNYDDDVVEIHSDCELESEKPNDDAKNVDDSETWQQRYLQSSSVKNVLKTTKLATKVRVKLAANKKSQEDLKKMKKVEEKQEKDKEQERTQKISQLEEGSLEQFQGLKDTGI